MESTTTTSPRSTCFFSVSLRWKTSGGQLIQDPADLEAAGKPGPVRRGGGLVVRMRGGRRRTAPTSATSVRAAASRVHSGLMKRDKPFISA